MLGDFTWNDFSKLGESNIAVSLLAEFLHATQNKGCFLKFKTPTKAYINLNYVLYIIIKCGLPEPNIVPKA